MVSFRQVNTFSEMTTMAFAPLLPALCRISEIVLSRLASALVCIVIVPTTSKGGPGRRSKMRTEFAGTAGYAGGGGPVALRVVHPAMSIPQSRQAISPRWCHLLSMQIFKRRPSPARWVFPDLGEIR